MWQMDVDTCPDENSQSLVDLDLSSEVIMSSAPLLQAQMRKLVLISEIYLKFDCYIIAGLAMIIESSLIRQ